MQTTSDILNDAKPNNHLPLTYHLPSQTSNSFLISLNIEKMQIPTPQGMAHLPYVFLSETLVNYSKRIPHSPVYLPYIFQQYLIWLCIPIRISIYILPNFTQNYLANVFFIKLLFHAKFRLNNTEH